MKLEGAKHPSDEWSKFCRHRLVAFNYYISTLHSQPNQPCDLILLTTSASLAMVRLELGLLRRSATLAASWRTLNTGAIFKDPAQPNVAEESSAFVTLLGGELWLKRMNRLQY